jgi:hypothetical protein
MKGGVVLSGLDELRHELTHAPEEIRREAMDILKECTEGAASDMAHRYPGSLGRSVRTSYPASAALVGIAQNTAPHSHLYEFGTKARRTAKGANRGVMPAASPAIVVPIAQSWRERMVTRIMAMLASRGFLVTR